ncbi:MAG: type II toxin-antitoxin system VapC family toxin [Gemmataceae bacterium]
MLIYFDSVIIIYLLDHTGSFQSRAAARLAVLETAGDRIGVSDLTRLECRVKPLALGDAVKLTRFDAFFTRPDVLKVPLTTAVYERDTLLRATYNFKLADSLHLAAAIENGCASLLTNDARLNRCTDIAVEVLP